MSERTPSAGEVRATSNTLRMWLIMSALFSFCSFAVIISMTKPMELIGFIFLMHCILALPVLFSFHACSLSDNALFVLNLDDNYGNDSGEWCGGGCGQGGTAPAFFAYIIALMISTYRLNIMYNTCATSSYRYRPDAWEYAQLITACILIVASIFFVELGKNSRSGAVYSV